MTELDITTTSVGRTLIRQTYESFFRHVHFSGRFHFIVTVDPAYGVAREEIDETLRWLRALPDIDPRVARVTVETWERNLGLQRSLLMLFSHCFAPFGINLEDDWRFFKDVDLDALLLDLADQRSTMIGFNSTHVSARGTFERPAELEVVAGSRVPLVRLVPPSWASDYLPLCPHLHRTDRWRPLYTRALMLDDDPDRCPDERVKEYVRKTDTRKQHNLLWTRDVVVEDIGRAWLAERGQVKNIGADAAPSRAVPEVRLDGDKPALRRSQALLERAQVLIPGETQTFMKRPLHFAPGEYPVYLDRGAGPHVWDVDGNCYLDFIAALGAASLGHAHPLVTAAIRGNVARGVLLSLPTHLEIEAAECVTSIVPNAEQVRFLKTGADACSAAVRLARLITGREAIATCGYHGWHDLFTPGTPGVGPAPSLAFDPFAEGSLEAVLAAHRVACVLLALPYDRVMTRERMQHLATLSRESGALFILDEVVTGFRLAPGGAQEFFGVGADLVCLSKGLGAGMPIAAVAGARRHMERFAELHVSTTYGGELLSLAVTIAVLNHYRSSGYAERIASLGMRFAEAVNTRAADLGLAPVVRGYAPIPCLRFAGDEPRHQECARLFVAEAARRGVLFRRDVNFITGAHSEEDIDFAAAACGRALDQVARRMRQNAA